ncbi:MAG: zinc ribbon domain-containing protein [Eubacteriales bacterium]|nr:zinc ribbon domain-containing protein [Eubacteriales bacterium]
MYCEKCGKQLEPGSIFCDGCGARQAAGEQAAPPPPMEEKRFEGQQSQYSNNNNQGYNQNYNQSYNQNYNQNYNVQTQKVAPVLSVGQYIVMMIVFAIPIVNIIMLFVWGFGDSVNPNKKNYCRAALIMAAIGIVLSILFSAVIVSLIGSIIDSLGNSMYY